MKTKLHLVLSITILFLSFSGSAQSDYWKRVYKQAGNTRIIGSLSSKESLHTYELNQDALFDLLFRTSSTAEKKETLYFPNIKGEMIPYRITERSVFSEKLSEKYPRIKSYIGYSLKDRSERIRFSISPKGLQAMLIHGGNQSPATFIEKERNEINTYKVFSRNLSEELDKDFTCYTQDIVEKGSSSNTQKLVDDQILRVYRIAVSASGEYTQFHGGTVAGALGAINATLTRVNEVFETDLGVQLELIANTDQVIYTDPDTDPYNGNLNAEIQNTLTDEIGESNYDVGHLFHQDVDSGNAGFIGAVCRDNQKGSAYSQALNPEGDIFDLDFVAHELGHQFGANHTWSFESEGTLVQAEPASGTTIMGYAGIVPGDNVANNGDDYFHYYSIFQISEYLKSTSCGTLIPITNSPPQITPLMDYKIPIGTAFVLLGEAVDIDPTDVLTYTWEQIDDGVVTAQNFGPDTPGGANFRSLRPTTTPVRYFPSLSQVLLGNLTQTNPTVNSAWETVSNVEREMNFAFTVRDNAIGGGQVSSAILKVEVLSDSGPFEVISQSEPLVYTAGSVQSIAWDVANTNVAPVSAQTVDIFMSTDGGLSFPIELAAGTPNDGMQEVIIPGNITTTARIMVKASGNIFYSVNKVDFEVVSSDIVLNFPSTDYNVCVPNSIDIPFIYETYNGFNEEVTFEALGFPSGLDAIFNPLTALNDSTAVTVTFSNTALVEPGDYPITIRANSISNTKDITLQLSIQDTSFDEVPLLFPENNAREISPQPILEWEANSNYDSYDVEIAEDIGFTNIVDSASDILFNTYAAQNLQQQNIYFWRVKPKNSCGEGTFGPPFQFTTITISCETVTAIDVPVEISSIGTPTVSSTVSFFNDLPVSDINVVLNIEHTFLADLIITLTSPSGTEVTLTSNSCGDLRDIDAIFDDDGQVLSCDSSGGAAIKGIVRPLGSLASFNGESAFGEWILTVLDTAPADGGSINNFSLEICVEGQVRPDEDKDGVFDDGDDLCLGTPLGAEVDTNGCAVYRFLTDNFSIEAESESCLNSNDGSIAIDAKSVINHSITINGNGTSIEDSFTDTFLLENLSAGTYSLCIDGVDGLIVFEQICFDIVITEPEPLQVNSIISIENLEARLFMEGASLFNVELNGVMQQVSTSELVLNLKAGLNTLKVSSELACQGVYNETIFVADEPSVYPNPVRTFLTISLGSEEEWVDIMIYASDGRLIKNQRRSINGERFEISFETLPEGVYYLNIQGLFGKKAFKIIKQ
ncbi:MAG: reprolysin-like metallopeptidase [Eudoraea sp.]